MAKEKKKLVCTYHKEAQDLINKLRFKAMDIKSMTIRELYDLQDYLMIAYDELDSIIDKANNGAQSMENRLSDYRNAIEDLGFSRRRVQ